MKITIVTLLLFSLLASPLPVQGSPYLKDHDGSLMAKMRGVEFVPKQIAKEPSRWNGNVEISYLQTGGNTESQTFAGEGKAERAFKRAQLTGEARGLYGGKEGVTSEKSWSTSLKYGHNISNRSSVFVLESVERNTLKGIDFRYVHQGGIGHYFIKTETDTLKGEVGAGYVKEDRVDPLKDVGYANARAFLGYVHAFTEQTRFEQTVEYLPNLSDSEDYIINEETAVIANLMGQFALQTSFAVAFDHLPPPGFEKTDRVFKTALLYTF